MIAWTRRGHRGPRAAVRAHEHRDALRLRLGASCLAVAIALLWCNCALAAEPRVLLLRGWFGVFSTGMDSLASELKAKGIKAEVAGHVYWSTAVKDIVKERAAGNTGPLVLVGHSQGANNVIDMARSLEANKIPVDLLVTLAPFMQDPVPANVARVINYYQSPGWGAPLTADRGFHGKLSNISWRPDSEMVRNGRFMAANQRRHHPCRICLKRCHCLNHPVMLGLRVVACPVFQATNGKASHSHRAPQGGHSAADQGWPSACATARSGRGWQHADG